MMNCKDLDGRSRGLTVVLSGHFLGGTEDIMNHFRISGVLAEIQTQLLLSIRLEHYH
jgi:hypothetical protein